MMLQLAALQEIPWAYYFAPIGAIVALVMARVFAGAVLQRSEGDAEQIRIAAAVREGAMAYLFRQYRVVSIVFVGLILFLAFLAFGLDVQPRLTLVGVPIAGFLSGLAGYFGMRIATSASARTAAAAKESLNDGLTVAFRAGAVMGLTVVGFALLDASFWFIVLNGFGEQLGMAGDVRDFSTVMLSFAMGASTQALFARVGGGIYTKAADVGADLVGKVEAGIPEDDARNPATIADNVGDNVGDVAGMGADLYESYYGSILSTSALGAAAAFTIPGMVFEDQIRLALLLATAPLALAGLGILCSVVGIFMVRTREGAPFAELLKSLNKGIWIASALIVAIAFILLFLLLGGRGVAVDAGIRWWGIGGSIVSGLLAGLVIAHATEYYTSYDHPPTKKLSYQSLTGPATVIIGGVAEGMKSTWASLLTITAAIIAAYVFAGGADNMLIGLYGVAIAAVGMLSTLGITLATDAYGPIADNAGGNAEMSGQPPHVRERTDLLDSLGNTTAAIGKGFAIGSAALTALALFAAYVQVVQVQMGRQAETFYSRNTPATAPQTPYAIYEGHNKFALVFPGAAADGGAIVSGGMLMDRQAVPPALEDALQVGTIMAIRPADMNARTAANPAAARTLVGGLVSPGGQPQPDAATVEIISTRNSTLQDVLFFYNVTLLNPQVLGGLFIGVLLAFLFCALTMQAVGRAAYAMMNECRRQFAIMRDAFRSQGMSEADIANPEMWPKQVTYQGKQYPDYANCVSISTAGAQREMILPSILAIVVPIVVGLVLSVPGVVGMLAGGLTSGFAVAIFMANAGGAWDNAKKYVEKAGRTTANQFMNEPGARDRVPEPLRDAIAARSEEYIRTGHGDSYVYGKGSDAHKATVVGDTVGDPFKDTSGPSLNILIKLISIVSVVFAGLVVRYGPVVSGWIGLN
jgi:K(+)-stimulated pyrophosphate-energized sodium pump